MNLYGKDWSRRELETYVGRIEQIGGLQARAIRLRG